MGLARTAGTETMLPATLIGDDPAGFGEDDSAAVDADGARLNSESAQTSTAAIREPLKRLPVVSSSPQAGPVSPSMP
jgi:hypothetical protein